MSEMLSTPERRPTPPHGDALDLPSGILRHLQSLVDIARTSNDLRVAAHYLLSEATRLEDDSTSSSANTTSSLGSGALVTLCRSAPASQRSSLIPPLSSDDETTVSSPQPWLRSSPLPTPTSGRGRHNIICPICGGRGRKSTTRVCQTCYSGFYNDIQKIARMCHKEQEVFPITHREDIDLDTFRQFLRRKVKRCLEGYQCPPSAYSHLLSRGKRCKRCRTLAYLRKFPTFAHELIVKCLDRKDSQSDLLSGPSLALSPVAVEFDSAVLPVTVSGAMSPPAFGLTTAQNPFSMLQAGLPASGLPVSSAVTSTGHIAFPGMMHPSMLLFPHYMGLPANQLQSKSM